MPSGSPARENLRVPPARNAPGVLETLKWSALMLLASLLVAAISIPLLAWLGG